FSMRSRVLGSVLERARRSSKRRRRGLAADITENSSMTRSPAATRGFFLLILQTAEIGCYRPPAWRCEPNAQPGSLLGHPVCLGCLGAPGPLDLSNSAPSTT